MPIKACKMATHRSMNKTMKDLNDLYYFAQIVEQGGFSAAARALGVPKSRLSRRLQHLEDRLGARLLNRSSRRFSVTEVGRDYYERCRAMLVEAEAAEQVVAALHAKPSGVVRISCPTALLNFQFGALFARFMAENPGVEIHLDATNRHVDVMAEGLDIAIRVRFPPLAATSLVMRKLDISTQCLVGSPAFIASPLKTPGDLSELPSLGMGPFQQDHHWHLEGPEGETAMVPYRPRLIVSDIVMLREAALAALGVVQLPTLMVWRDIEEGRLIHALPHWRPRAGIVHAVFPSRRGVLPSVRVLLDYLARECARQRHDANQVLRDPLAMPDA